jgi:hypothetical protein
MSYASGDFLEEDKIIAVTPLVADNDYPVSGDLTGGAAAVDATDTPWKSVKAGTLMGFTFHMAEPTDFTDGGSTARPSNLLSP